jgi:hypothetical protein
MPGPGSSHVLIGVLSTWRASMDIRAGARSLRFAPSLGLVIDGWKTVVNAARLPRDGYDTGTPRAPKQDSYGLSYRCHRGVEALSPIRGSKGLHNVCMPRLQRVIHGSQIDSAWEAAVTFQAC